MISIRSRAYYQFLNDNQFDYQRVEHPPVYTCAEAERLRPDIAAVSTKNLFLCDKKGRKFYLVVTACEKEYGFQAARRTVRRLKAAFWFGRKPGTIAGRQPRGGDGIGSGE